MLLHQLLLLLLLLWLVLLLCKAPWHHPCCCCCTLAQTAGNSLRYCDWPRWLSSSTKYNVRYGKCVNRPSSTEILFSYAQYTCSCNSLALRYVVWTFPPMFICIVCEDSPSALRPRIPMGVQGYVLTQVQA